MKEGTEREREAAGCSKNWKPMTKKWTIYFLIHRMCSKYDGIATKMLGLCLLNKFLPLFLSKKHKNSSRRSWKLPVSSANTHTHTVIVSEWNCWWMMCVVSWIRSNLNSFYLKAWPNKIFNEIVSNCWLDQFITTN